VATLLTPRPLPARRLPMAAGALVVAFCLPVFVLAGWSLRAWAFGAVLWLASQALGILFDRIGIHEPTLRGSGVVAFGMMTRGILVMVVAIAVAVSDPQLALAGALVYAFAYSLELAFSLVLYFSGRPVS
jgi:4-hydroxybenzoate polyprenyltransferase